MKTLCHRKTDESLHLFSDSTNIYLFDGSLWFKYKEQPDFKIEGFDEKNFIIYDNVTAPSYWKSRNYKYNPKYGWKPNDNFNYQEDCVESLLKYFSTLCYILKSKQILSESEYDNLLDFSTVEIFMYKSILDYQLR